MPASALVRRVFIGLLAANLAVVGVKLAVGLSSGSLAVLGGAVDSCVDALNNVLALIVVRVAAKEPDEDHPYGHGKFETLGALAIVGFLSITCFELIRGAVNELLQGAHPVGVTDSQLAVLVLTLGVNVVIAWYENRRGRELRSELLVADAAHTRVDALITVGVLTGVLFARQGWWWADPAVAIVVALLIVLVAYRILVRTVPVLVDQRALPTHEIQKTAERVPGVKSAYGIRSREALLEIGDEAVRELEESSAGQYLLTEVLLLEHVDRIIARRLRLPAFPRWRLKHRALRAAQREPTHWGLEPDGPLVRCASRLDPGDVALVMGAAALPAALYLAAHDAEVFLLDQDLGAIEAAEGRAVTEQLAGRFHALVINWGSWLPDVAPSLVVLDPAALAPARARDRNAVIADLKTRTPPGGVHVVLASATAREVIPLAPEALQAQYGGWHIARRRRTK